MPIAAGQMNQRVRFMRRNAGVYAPLGPAHWGRLRYERAATVTIAGVPFQGRQGQLTVRACDVTRTLGVGDRCELDGSVFEISIRRAPQHDSDDLILEIESAPTSGLYAQEMDRRGQLVGVRRTLEDGTKKSATVRAIIEGFAADELIGDIDQGVRKIWLLAADLVEQGFPLPISKNDRIIVRGTPLNVQSVDADTHRSAGILNAYFLLAKGEQGA